MRTTSFGFGGQVVCKMQFRDPIGRSARVAVLSTPTSADYSEHVRCLQVSVANLERYGADLYLALACGNADPKAVRTLEQRFFPELDRYLAHAGFVAVTRQDVFQQLLLKLCAGETPRIMSYAGRAALGSWLRVATYRLAMAIGERSQSPRTCDSNIAISHLVSHDADPETQAAIDKARPRFQAALQSVMDGLRDRDRTLLRLSFDRCSRSQLEATGLKGLFSSGWLRSAVLVARRNHRVPAHVAYRGATSADMSSEFRASAQQAGHVVSTIRCGNVRSSRT